MGRQAAMTTAPVATRPWRRWAVVGSVAATVIVVAVGFYWAQTQAPSRDNYASVGVARLDEGHVAIVLSACYPGISDLEIVNDTTGNSSLEVSAVSGSARNEVAVSTKSAGYEYTGSLVDPVSGDQFRVRILRDAKGVNRITKKPLTWRPSELVAGAVQMADGARVPLDEWSTMDVC